jgi:nucleoside phosphorylase/DNA-binding NarL/FixJ family response regulator
MKILLIEDYKEKRDQIIELLDEKYNHRLDIEIAINVESAKEKIGKTEFDLYILDLSIKDGNSEATIDNGLLLFDILKTDKKNIIIYSNVDDLQKRGQEKIFEQYNIPFIDYKSSGIIWKESLLKEIEELIKKNNIILNDIAYDIAILTALEDEFDYMIKASNLVWFKNTDDDNFVYFTTKLKKNTKFVKIVAFTNNMMGMSNSAVLSTKLILKFKPKYIVMTGICAGIEGKTSKGDIIIPQYVFNYQEGDIKDEKFTPSFKPKELNTRLHRMIEQSKNSYSIDIRTEWETTYNIGKTPGSEFKVHTNKHLGTGSAVVKSEKILNDIQELYQKDILGLDMEAYSLFIAAENSEVETNALVIKAVQDFANKEKDKEYRQFASYASARFFFKFCEDRLIDKIIE